MVEKCQHLSDILNAEVPIIKRHLAQHKWYKHIEDDTQAKIDFIEEYGGIMRDFYCHYVCIERDTCVLVKEEDKKLYNL